MAYFRRYSRYARRRRSTRSTGRKRSVRYSRSSRYGRRRYGRRSYRPRRYVRKLNGISPYDKKKDTMASWNEGNGSFDSTLGDSSLSQASNTSVFVFCPTFIPKDAGDGNAEYQRLRDPEAWKIQFTGFAEKCLIRAMTGTIWRRIAVWSYSRVGIAQPITRQEGDASFLARNLNPVDHSQTTFRQWLFQGAADIDYQPWSMVNAPLNRSHFKVAMDRTITINPNHAHTGSGDAGQIFVKKDWIRGGKIVYEDKEYGSGMLDPGDTSPDLTQGFSSYSRESRGNLYIVDIFFSPDQNDYGFFQTESTRYWLEG